MRSSDVESESRESMRKRREEVWVSIGDRGECVRRKAKESLK